MPAVQLHASVGGGATWTCAKATKAAVVELDATMGPQKDKELFADAKKTVRTAELKASAIVEATMHLMAKYTQSTIDAVVNAAEKTIPEITALPTCKEKFKEVVTSKPAKAFNKLMNKCEQTVVVWLDQCQRYKSILGAPVEDEAAVSAREAVLGKMEGVRVSFMIMQAFFTDASPTVWAKVKQHYVNKRRSLAR